MSSATEVRSDRKYTKDHEWAREQDGTVVVGISAFAVDQLGDITLVNLDVKVGDVVKAHQTFGTIESVKTLSDLYTPVAGSIVRINPELENRPELINEDPWDKGWMIAIQPSGPSEVASLLDAGAYSKLLESAEH